MTLINVTTEGRAEEQCPICQDNIGDGPAQSHEGGLQHLFHPACIGPWLRGHTTCPMCRAQVITLPTGFHPIEDAAQAVRTARGFPTNEDDRSMAIIIPLYAMLFAFIIPLNAILLISGIAE